MAEMEEGSSNGDRRRGTPVPYILSTTVNDLPFDIMDLIFALLPMQFVFALRLVCRYWNTSILTRCSITKHLNLKVCCVEDDVVEYDTELLYYSGNLMKRIKTNQEAEMTLRVTPWRLTPTSVDFLLHAFDDLKSITIQYNGCSPQDGIAPVGILLRKLPVLVPQLSGFTFWYIPKGNGILEHQDDFKSLHADIDTAVAQMTKLTKLNICLDSKEFCKFLKNGSYPLECLNVLPGLEQFGLNIFTANLNEMIGALSPGRLTHLSLDCEHFESPDHIERLFRVANPGLTKSVTHLRLNHPKDPKHLTMLCTLFAESTQQLTIAFYGCARKWKPNKKFQLAWERKNRKIRRLKNETHYWFAVLNSTIMEALSRMSQLKELLLFNCLTNPNICAAIPNVQKLTLSVGGEFIAKYLQMIDQNVQRRRPNESNDESAREFVAVLVGRHFTNLNDLSLVLTCEQTGTLLRTALEPYNQQLSELYIGGHSVEALNRSHARRKITRKKYHIKRVWRWNVVWEKSCEVDSNLYFPLVRIIEEPF